MYDTLSYNVMLEVINMPSQTFFNLDYSKQKKLLDAAKQEFCKVPYTEAVSYTHLRAHET